jgi:hypothetical protein
MRAILTALGRLLRVSRPNKRNVKEMERQVRLLREKIRCLQRDRDATRALGQRSGAFAMA